MQHIAGLSRQQLQISSLEQKIALDKSVRFIEVFVEHISLEVLFLQCKNRGSLASCYSLKKLIDNSISVYGM